MLIFLTCIQSIPMTQFNIHVKASLSVLRQTYFIHINVIFIQLSNQTSFNYYIDKLYFETLKFLTRYPLEICLILFAFPFVVYF